jgi:hypothetical protein
LIFCAQFNFFLVSNPYKVIKGKRPKNTNRNNPGIKKLLNGVFSSTSEGRPIPLPEESIIRLKPEGIALIACRNINKISR